MEEKRMEPDGNKAEKMYGQNVHGTERGKI
jgi:hypothetical protein